MGVRGKMNHYNSCYKNFVAKVCNLATYPVLIATAGKKFDRTTTRYLLYLKKEMRFEPNTIIDVGASIGAWSEAARFVYPNSKIYSFEPIPDSYSLLARRSYKHRGTIRVFNYAVGDESGERTLYVSDHLPASSLLKMTVRHKSMFPCTDQRKEIRVPVKRLDEVEEVVWEEPILVKIDVQGFELNVLRGVGMHLSRVSVIQIEINFEDFYDEQASSIELFSFLHSHGFRRMLQMSPPLVNNTFVACDFLFFR